MHTIATFVGLDVHKDSISVATAPADGGPAEQVGTIPNDLTKLFRVLRKLGEPAALRCCYEAGPTGYGLVRALRSKGVDCEVIAPSRIPKLPGDRIKTDQRDAVKLARFLRSGDLTAISVPLPETEALRDLVRARSDAKADERAARHRLVKFLLRHDRKYLGKTSWTKTHIEWIRSQHFDHAAQDAVLREYLHSVEQLGERLARLDRDIETAASHSECRSLIEALQSLRGVRLLTAASLAAEVGDFRRFPTARDFMSYLGLVPSEYSSGSSRRQGRITKTGNGHVRRLLVESSWSYRFKPRVSRELRARSKAASPAVQSIAWKAQHRLHDRYRRLLARGKRRQVVITALARELAGFVWSIGQEATATSAA